MTLTEWVQGYIDEEKSKTVHYIVYGDHHAKVVKICFCGHSEESHSTHPTGTSYCNACADDYEAHEVIPWHKFHEAA